MRAPIHRSRGFTLIELMIAVALGLIVLAALTSFFVRTSANRSEMERNSRQIENGRYAVNALRDDLALAGFYADITQPSSTVWQTPAACVTTVADMGVVPDGLAPKLPVPVFVYPEGVGRPVGCTPDYLAGTDVLVIRRFNSEPVTVASITGSTPAANQVFVQVSACKDDPPGTPYLIDTGANAANLKLKKLDCATAAQVRRYREQLYYVRDYSTTAGDGIPTLVRVELDGSAAGIISNPVPLVEGIENLRVDFGIDTDGDGFPEAWKRCVAAAPCTAADYSNVMAAKVHVLSRNLEKSSGYTDDKTYSMGASGTVTPASAVAGYKRHVYSAQVAMPNRSGPREPALAS